MRIWGKLWKENHLLRDMVVSNDSPDTRTHKVFAALEEICRAWDLSVPIWLEANVRDFKRSKRVRFRPENFVGEDCGFDYLELIVLEED